MSRRYRIVLTCLLPFLLLAQQQTVSPEDRKRFEEIKARHDHGEQVSQEDQAFAMRIMRILNGGQKGNQQANQQRNAEFAKNHPPRIRSVLSR